MPPAMLIGRINSARHSRWFRFFSPAPIVAQTGFKSKEDVKRVRLQYYRIEQAMDFTASS
jgi:hypothetical protein